MQNLPTHRLCVRCRAALNHNQAFCSFCGTQQPQFNQEQQPKKNGLSTTAITAIVVVCVLFGSCSICGLFGAMIEQRENKQQTSVISATPTATPVSTAQPSPTPKPVGSNAERLQVAADVRHYLRDQDIPALVVASGSTLNVTYTYARMEYEPDETFMRQQGKQGFQRMANAGFETLVIEARDSSGYFKQKEFSLIKYRK
jgi:predicted nucleic acid-binding Zn ribbon protein